MGLNKCVLREGGRYRVQTTDTVFYGVFGGREAIDGEQYLLFLDEGSTTEDDCDTTRVRAKSIRDVRIDWD